MTTEALLALEVCDSGEVRGMPKSGRLAVGSAKTADLRLDDPRVAPEHCVLGRTSAGRWMLQDLGAESGTRVNGTRAERKLLFAGDELLVGDTLLRVVDLNEPGDERIAGFRIERPVGRGSMGEVFLAVQESLQRRVALKVLPAELAEDRAFIRRFQREARAAAALSHPNVVHVYDVGEDGGRHWLAMEFMDGGSLEDLVARLGPRPWPEVVRILRDAAAGLVFAAERDIVHRDIKPANLMRDASGTVKIADLGLAANDGADGGERVYGTPQFVAPEQARGEAVDPRADLYSLGATAWRLLTARPLFEGRNTLEILRHKIHHAAPLIADELPELPAELADLIDELVERDPADRPQTAAAVLARLQGLDDETGAAAREPARGPGLAVAVVAVVLLALGAGAWFLLPTAEEPARTTTAVQAEPASPADLPSLDVAPGAEAAPVDDSPLAGLESRAEDALRDLERRRESGTVAEDEWRSLAASFAGTDAARRADEIADEIAGREHDLEVREATLTAELDELRRALESSSGSPAERLAELFAMDLERVPLDAEASATWLNQLARTWLRAEEAELEAALDRVADEREAGRFDEAEQLLIELRAAFTGADELDASRVAADWARFLEHRAEIETRLTALPAERSAWQQARVANERRLVAETLRGRDAVEGDLRELRLERAAERLDDLAASVKTEALREMLGRWARDLARAELARRTLITTHRSGTWRRRGISDPRGGAAEIVDLDETSVTLARGGTADRLPWSTFVDAEALHQLFNGRLDRAYTDDERAGVGVLLRVACALALVDHARASVLADAGTPRPTDLDRAFELAEEWAPGDPGLQRERRARRLLEQVADELERGDWSAATFPLERLLREPGGSWTVLLLSDGRRDGNAAED